MARLNWRKATPGRRSYEAEALWRRRFDHLDADSAYAEPDADPEGLLDLIPTDLKEPFDPREVIARIVDGTE